MRGMLIGFALGIVWLQQQAALPGVLVICAFLCVFACCCTLACWVPRWRNASLACAVFVVGFGYAAWRAETRLQYALPAAFESRNIELTGFVRGLPLQGEDGTRFLFEVESNEAGIAKFPRVVQLSWMAVDASKRGPAAAPPPGPGPADPAG